MVENHQRKKFQKFVKKRRKTIPVLLQKKGDGSFSKTSKPAPPYIIDYKNKKLLLNFINPQRKILSRKVTGLTAKQQRGITKAIKRARMGCILQYTRLDFSKTKDLG